MGAYENIVVGAYLECENNKKYKDIYNYVCEKCENVYSDGSVFCKKCGVELKQYSKIRKESNREINISDFYGEIDDKLYCSSSSGYADFENDIWISNLYKFECGIVLEENKCFEIDQQFIEKCLSTFKEAFKNEIEILEKAYNNKVSLKFGAIKYYS